MFKVGNVYCDYDCSVIYKVLNVEYFEDTIKCYVILSNCIDYKSNTFEEFSVSLCESDELINMNSWLNLIIGDINESN